MGKITYAELASMLKRNEELELWFQNILERSCKISKQIDKQIKNKAK